MPGKFVAEEIKDSEELKLFGNEKAWLCYANGVSVSVDTDVFVVVKECEHMFYCVVMLTITMTQIWSYHGIFVRPVITFANTNFRQNVDVQ